MFIPLKGDATHVYRYEVLRDGRYGVRSAMPGFIAVEMVKNPQLVGSKMPPEELIFVAPNFAKYTKAGEVQKMGVFDNVFFVGGNRIYSNSLEKRW